MSTLWFYFVALGSGSASAANTLVPLSVALVTTDVPRTTSVI